MSQTYSLESMLFVIFIIVVALIGVGLFIKQKPANERQLGWGTQDWLWLIAFVLYAQIFTVLYKEMVMDVVSYVSTFVSTALGAVAIYISVREATKVDKTKEYMNVILGELREKLSQMDNKMDKLDPRIVSHLDETAEITTEEIASKLEGSQDLTRDQVINIIRGEINKANENLKISLSENVNVDKSVEQRQPVRSITSVARLINNMDKGTAFTATEIQNKIHSIYNFHVSSNLVEYLLRGFTKDGRLDFDGVLYTKK